MQVFSEEPLHLTCKEGAGYFPGYPGLKLSNGRYTITKKLGWGPRSSTWLITDLQEPSRYYALKVLTAHETLLDVERKNLILGTPPAFPILLDCFITETRRGNDTLRHQCFVMHAQGMPCEAFRLESPTGSLDTYLSKHIFECIVKNLRRMHEAGFFHGCVTTDNVLFEAYPQRDHMDELFEEFGYAPCEVDQWITVEGTQYPIVHSRPLPCYYSWDSSPSEFLRNDVRLLNVGHGQFDLRNGGEETPTWERARMPRAIRPPEAILGLPMTAKSDIWQIGCMAFLLLVGEPLVPESKAVDDITMLSWLIAMIGGVSEVPSVMAMESSLRSSQYFSKDGEYLHEVPQDTLEARIRSKDHIDEEDIPGIMWFLSACLCFKPETRASIDILQRCDWLNYFVTYPSTIYGVY